MLTGKSRPVPSKATLQLLYQLAYISSGTAVGIGFLCAEERRRRTQIVQRIADNAKKIRQSPRYAHNAAALAIRETAGEEFYHAPSDVTPETFDTLAENESIQRRTHGPGFDEAVKGPELPSVLEKAYEQHHVSSEGGMGRVKRKRPQGNRASASQNAGASSNQAAPSPSSSTHGRISGQNSALGSNGRGWARHGVDEIGRAGLQANGIDSEGQKGGLHSPRQSLVRDMAMQNVNHQGRPTATRKPRRRMPRREDFKTLRVDGEDPTWDKGQVEEIFRDVDLFISLTRDASDRLDLRHCHSICKDLIAASAKKGLLRQVKLLCRWMRQHSVSNWLDHNVIDILCQERHILSRRSEPKELFDFYAEVFKSATISSLPRILLTLSEALTWNIDGTPYERAEALLGVFVPLQQDEQDALLNALKHFCMGPTCPDERHDLESHSSEVQEVSTQQRSELLLAVAPMVKATPGFEILLHRTFEISLAEGRLATCAKLLRTADELGASVMAMKRYELLLAACDARDEYDLVRGLFKDTPRPFQLQAKQLGARYRKIVLKARAAHNVITHKTLRAMNLQEGQNVSLILQGLRIRLRHVWRSTFERDRMNAELRDVRDSLDKYGNKQSRRIFQIAKLEYFIMSNQVDLALRLLSSLHAASANDPETISLAAVLFAKSGAWDAFTKLLAHAREHKIFDNSDDGRRRINTVIRFHARNFGIAETWKLVTELVAEHGFRPNSATTGIMLEAFVSHRTIPLIPQWLAYVGSLGAEVKLDSILVTKILKRYYRENRPSHVLMMKFCRSLIQLAPMLKGPGYIDVLKEAIGYDLRLAHKGTHLTRQVIPPAHIEARLHRVEMLKDDCADLPGPGKPFNGQLVFGSPKRKTDNTSDVAAAGPSDDSVYRNVSPKDLSEPREPQVGHGQGNVTRDHEENGQTSDHLRNAADLSERLLESYNMSQPQIAEWSVDDDAEPADLQSLLPTDSFGANFGNLREPYYDLAPGPNSESPADMGFDERALELGDVILQSERDMILAFSVGEYDRIVNMCKTAVDAGVLPPSPFALEVAVEASLRRNNGDQAEAMQLMEKAHAAGLNATCAMGPLIIHQMRSLNVKDPKDLDKLRTTATEYYQLNDENGWPIKHHVGVAAAAIMIQGGRPQHSLNLLDAIYRSDHAKHRPFEIEAMSVYLQGYALSRNIAGVKWVVDQVLDQNIQIDRAFCHILKRCRRFFVGDDSQDPDNIRRQDLVHQRAQMQYFLDKCRARRSEQRVGLHRLGQALVKTLVRVAKQQAQPVLDLASKAYVEASVFGTRRASPAEPDSSELESHAVRTPQSIFEQRTTARRMAILRHIKVRLHSRRFRGQAKQLQYRRFLQLRMVSGNNRTRMSFRYSPSDAGAAQDRKPDDAKFRPQDWFEPVGGPPMNQRRSGSVQTTAEGQGKAR